MGKGDDLTMTEKQNHKIIVRGNVYFGDIKGALQKLSNDK